MKTDVDKISNIYSSMFCPDKRFAPRLAVTVKQMSMESSWVMLATLEPPNDIGFCSLTDSKKAFTHLHRAVFTHKIFHTEKIRETFAQMFYAEQILYKRTFATEQLLHTVFFCTHKFLYTQGSFDTQTLLHTNAFTQRIFHTEQFLHTEVFAHRSLYTERFLHTHTIHKRFYTQTLLRRKFVGAQQLLDTNALSHRSV